MADGRKSKGLTILKPNNYLQGSVFAEFHGGFCCSKKGLWELAVKAMSGISAIKTKCSNPSRVKKTS